MGTTTKVLTGEYKGAEVQVLGTDVEVLGDHLFKVLDDISREYMIRFPRDIPSVLGTIYIAKLSSNKKIALHESEIGDLKDFSEVRSEQTFPRPRSPA
jgi:hypothetical protein